MAAPNATDSAGCQILQGFYDLNSRDLGNADRDLAHATAMVDHTFGEVSYRGFAQLSPDTQQDYFWAIHARLKAARKALGRVMLRVQFDTAEDALRAEEDSSD